MTSLSKSFSLEEVEALLAAERERCAKVAEVPDAWTPFWHGQPPPEAIAAAIRSLAPQTIGGEE